MSTSIQRRRLIKGIAVAPVLALPAMGVGASARLSHDPAAEALPGSDPNCWALRRDGPRPVTALLFGGDSWTLEDESAEAFANGTDRRWQRIAFEDLSASATVPEWLVVMANPDDHSSFYPAYLYAVHASRRRGNAMLLAARPDPRLQEYRAPWLPATDTARYVAQTVSPAGEGYFLGLIEETVNRMPASQSVLRDYDCRVFGSLRANTSLYLTGYSEGREHIALGGICVHELDIRQVDGIERDGSWEIGVAEGEGRAARAAEEALQRLTKLDSDLLPLSHATVYVTAGPELAMSEIEEVRRTAKSRLHEFGTTTLLAQALRPEDSTYLAVEVDVITPKESSARVSWS